MQHLEEGTIHAWLDGELPLAAREAAEAHVAGCAACAAAVAEARGFIAASSRILTSLDGVPGGVLPRARSAPVRRFTMSRAWMAVAAVMVLGVGTVIATQHQREVAELRVASQREEAKPTAVVPKAGAAALDKASMDSTAPAAIASTAPRQPARAPAASPPRAAGAIASGVPGAANKVEVRARNAPAPAPVALAARDTVAAGADTTITSIYTVHGVLVSLVDRPSSKALQRAPSASDTSGFSDAVMAKARAQAPPENSITWSDSTGRTRTLRGAMSHEALERLRARLFGTTP